MGSYLSVVNNTKDRWQCRLSHDEAAVKISTIALTTIGSVAATVVTLGGGAPIAAALTANGVVSVFGVSTSALATVTGAAAAASTAATVIGGVSGFSLTVTETITKNLAKEGYHTIEPGSSYKWGKMSLSLWQQATCIKTVNVDERTVRTEKLYMRPIFSGPTDGSNHDHEIQAWLDSRETEKEDIVAQDKKPEARSLEEVSESKDSKDFEVGKVYYFYPNGTTKVEDANL